MIIKFDYGFIHEDFIFGWNKEELYRLPSTSGNKTYGLKKLNQIMVGVKVGYRIKKEKYTIQQLKDRTIFMEKEFQIIDSPDIPK